MNFEEYFNALKEVYDSLENPKSVDVVTSVDDEGNGFRAVVYSPQLGNNEDGEFLPNVPAKSNTVCLN